MSRHTYIYLCTSPRPRQQTNTIWDPYHDLLRESSVVYECVIQLDATRYSRTECSKGVFYHNLSTGVKGNEITLDGKMVHGSATQNTKLGRSQRDIIFEILTRGSQVVGTSDKKQNHEEVGASHAANWYQCVCLQKVVPTKLVHRINQGKGCGRRRENFKCTNSSKGPHIHVPYYIMETG